MARNTDMGGFDALEAMLDPKVFFPIFMANATTRLNRTGMIAGVVARRLIKARAYAANKQSTIDAKGSSTPLVNHADLFGSIRHEVKQDPEAILMMLLGASKRSETGHNIARTLHEGTKDGKIPPRHYIARALQDARVLRSFNSVIGSSMKATAAQIKATRR